MSDDVGVQNEFINILKSRNGTLALSWLNLIEFSNVSELATRKRAEEFIEKVLPNVFLMEVNPFKVIRRENVLPNNGQPIPPHADRDFLRLVGTMKTQSLSGFSARGLFEPMHKPAVAAEFAELSSEIMRGVESHRNQHSGSLNFRKLIQRPPHGPKLQHGTRYIFRELARTFLVDQSMPVTSNHAIDLLHAAVPVSYCDFVLLDAHWEEQISRVRKRFDSAKMEVPLAQAFSKRARGIARFLAQLAQ